MRGNNFHHANSVGLALASQSVSNTTVNGETISEPWRTGRRISFLAVGGAFAASASGRLKVQGLQRADGSTWENLKESDGTTDLEFTAASLDDGGAGENAVLLGTLPMAKLDATTYKAIRVTFQSEGAQAMLMGVAYVISELYERASGQSDDLFSKIMPGSPAL